MDRIRPRQSRALLTRKPIMIMIKSKTQRIKDIMEGEKEKTAMTMTMMATTIMTTPKAAGRRAVVVVVVAAAVVLHAARSTQSWMPCSNFIPRLCKVCRRGFTSLSKVA